MKAITIALKDLKRSFRSAFALMFMFVIPLFVTGMFYLMFGGMATGSAEAADAATPDLPKARLALANLDLGSPELSQGLALIGPNAAQGSTLGSLMVAALQNPNLSSWLEIYSVRDETVAKAAVDSGQADAALIIPIDFSQNYALAEGQAVMRLYPGTGNSIGASMAQGAVEQISEMLAGMKVAMLTAAAQSPQTAGDPAAMGALAQQYSAWMIARAQHSMGNAAVNLRAPLSASAPLKPAGNPISQIIGPIMSGMLVFFAFFTGASSAQTILKEDEEGTLARLMTTPTPLGAILGGKFLAVGLTVLVQVSVLLSAAYLIFHIQWGELLPTALTGLGIAACSTTFGIFLTSLLKSTRQSGAVYGGLLTVLGMVGMLGIFAGAQLGNSVALLAPQGWAVRGLQMGMNGAALGDVALNLAVLLALSLVFIGAGALRFQRRYA